jgi:hypothetical protein
MVSSLMRKVAPQGRTRRMSGPAALSRPSPSVLGSFTQRINSGLQSLVGGLRDSSFSGALGGGGGGGGGGVASSFSAGSRATGQAAQGQAGQQQQQAQAQQ